MKPPQWVQMLLEMTNVLGVRRSSVRVDEEHDEAQHGHLCLWRRDLGWGLPTFPRNEQDTWWLEVYWSLVGANEG